MMRQLPRSAARAGFSIIEVIFALIIIGIIGAIVGYNLVGMASGAKVSATKTSMQTIQGALNLYKTQNNAYPASGQLNVLVEARILPAEVKDGWGRTFYYYSPTASYEYELISYGEDGQEGGTGVNADIIAHPELTLDQQNQVTP
ncbi:MAG TPA: type II secretion system protein GspG [Phycisphaerales bacterium]|nr:type II secretion system protein GspG [Phycisphaerales bacterium]